MIINYISEGCGGTTPGGKCIVRCTNGDVHELTCEKNGEWDNPPTCPFTICPALYPLGNGSLSGSCMPGVVDEACIIECNVGFYLVPASDNEIICTEEGWVNI